MDNSLVKLQKIVTISILVTIIVLAFLLGNYIQLRFKNTIISDLYYSLSSKDEQLAQITEKINEQINEKDFTEAELEKLEGEVLGLTNEVNELTKELDSVVTETTSDYPFAVPTTGVIATFAGSYGGNMMGIEHWGVDIWSTLENNGVTSDFKGNPVFSICDGQVTRILPGNGAFRMKCDDIDSKYNVPARNDVYVYYGHLGHATTKQLFFNLSVGQRLKKGELIGHQGNLSDVFPDMRNVHLHLTIYSGRYQPLSTSGGPHNPCLYIGGDCSRPGSRFQAD